MNALLPDNIAIKSVARQKGFSACWPTVELFGIILLLAACLQLTFVQTQCAAQDNAGSFAGSDRPPQQMAPLQGSVEQTHKNRGTNLNGGIDANAQQPLTGGAQGYPSGPLTGGAQGYPSGPLQQMVPATDAYPGQPPMQGFAGQNPYALNASADPDEADQELQVQWDIWRNNLIHAIQLGALARINVHNEQNFVFDPRKRMMVSRYPLGLSAWYACEVLPNGRIINIRLTQPSQFPSYDQAVLQAINDLQGNRILAYPAGSRRQIVSQEASVKTAGETQIQNTQFGDVETQRHHKNR